MEAAAHPAFWYVVADNGQRTVQELLQSSLVTPSPSEEPDSGNAEAVSCGEVPFVGHLDIDAAPATELESGEGAAGMPTLQETRPHVAGLLQETGLAQVILQEDEPGVDPLVAIKKAKKNTDEFWLPGSGDDPSQATEDADVEMGVAEEASGAGMTRAPSDATPAPAPRDVAVDLTVGDEPVAVKTSRRQLREEMAANLSKLTELVRVRDAERQAAETTATKFQVRIVDAAAIRRDRGSDARLPRAPMSDEGGSIEAVQEMFGALVAYGAGRMTPPFSLRHRTSPLRTCGLSIEGSWDWRPTRYW